MLTQRSARRAVYLAVTLLLAVIQSFAQPASDTRTDVEKRVESILSQMTLEEKVDMIGGVDSFFLRELPRLNLPRLRMADGPLGQCPGVADWSATGPAGPHPVDLEPGESPGEGVRPCVAHQMHDPTPSDQLAGERLGRKAMAAGAAGGKHEGLHESVLPASRRRVRASAIPIASASASIEDPP